jgi:hypothetical protein
MQFHGYFGLGKPVSSARIASVSVTIGRLLYRMALVAAQIRSIGNVGVRSAYSSPFAS